MKKLTLGQWVDVAELVVAAGVIVSLLLVAHSIERNTAAMQGGTENLLFGSHTALASQMISDPSLAEIRVKAKGGQALTQTETIRWDTYQQLMLDVWATGYMRHQDGLLPG
jgi:hypothetical protein